MLPLDFTGFGQLQRHSIRAAEAFDARARRFTADIADVAHACVPFAPDTNLVCIAINPRGNRDLGRASAFVRQLHDGLRCNPKQPLQLREFFGSVTSLHVGALAPADAACVLECLGIDAPPRDEDDALVILRHTLMNPYLIDHENGISYIDRYFDFLAGQIRARLGT